MTLGSQVDPCTFTGTITSNNRMNFAPTLPSPLLATAALLAVFALLPTGKSWAFAYDSSAELCHHAARAGDIRGALDSLPPPCTAAAVRPPQEMSSRLLQNPGLTVNGKFVLLLTL